MWLETKKARNFNAVVWVLGEVNGYPASVSSVGESLPLTAPTKERRWSAHPVTAIDIERLGHDVVAVRAGQEHRRRTVTLRSAHPSERDRFPDLALFLADRQTLVFSEQRIDLVPHGGIDHAGCDGVDEDAVLDQVEAERLGQADHRRLGCAVDRHQRLAPAARLGGHVNDLTATALLDHLPGDRLQGEE